MRLITGFIPLESGGHTPIDGYTSAVSITSDPIAVHNALGYSVQVSWPATGTPVGTFTIQASNDLEGQFRKADSNLVNWFTLSGTSTASSVGTGAIISVPDVYYRWIRLVYTRSSGSITLSARAMLKGPE